MLLSCPEFGIKKKKKRTMQSRGSDFKITMTGVQIPVWSEYSYENLDDILLFIIMCTCVFPECMSIHQVYAVPKTSKGEHGIPPGN